MSPQEKARIGDTELEVTRLGLGTGALGGLYEDVPEEAAINTVRRAFDLGMRFFDTAPLYGHSKSELFLGRALTHINRDSYVLATKVGRLLVPEDPKKVESIWFKNIPPLNPVFDFSYDAVMRSIEESLKRLKLSRIDILHIHDPEEHYEEAMKGAYPALVKLRSERVISAIGVGTNVAEVLVRFAREGDFDCFLLANRYTLIDHTGLKELLPLCVAKHISIFIGGPFNSGILATGARPGAKFDYREAPPDVMEKVQRIEAVCARHGVSLKSAALQFPLAHPAVTAVIPGARSVAEIEENFRAMNQPIPVDFWEELRTENLLPHEAPVPVGGL